MLSLAFYCIFTFAGAAPGPNHIFLALNIGVTYYFIKNLWEYSVRLKEDGVLGPFFLFQFISLQAYAFESKNLSILFLAIIPIIAGLYFLKRKGAILLVIAPVSYYAFSSFSRVELGPSSDLIILSTVAIWAAGLVSWEDLFYLKNNKKVPNAGDEKLFVHDLINQTHGLSLYLNMKAKSGESINSHECSELVTEIEVMQSLIKDHFGYEHQNLNNTLEWTNFLIFKPAFEKIVKSFLDFKLTKVSFIYSGYLSEENISKYNESCQVHFPSLYRMMVNIVKNMAEEKTTSAEFTFHFDESGLHITTKNRLAGLASDENLSIGLNKIILEDKSLRAGDGLESIGALCEKLGGSYSFQITDGHWINEIFILDDYSSKKVA